MVRRTAIMAVTAFLPVSLLADFSYEQTSKMTGGMMAGMMKFAGAFSKQAREPMVSTIAVKGDRMVHWNPHRAVVIDLGKETITSINFDKKQFSATTFEQMNQALAASAQKMKSSNSGDMTFKVSSKDTGQKKMIAGFDTRELIITLEAEKTDKQTGDSGGMQIITDLWLAPKVAGYEEITNFYKRMGQKVSWSPGGMAAMGGRPDLAKGFAEVYKETAKLDTMPVFQIVKMGFHAKGQAQEGQATAQQPRQQEQQQAEKPSIGGLLKGGLGGFGKRKKPEEQPESGNAEASGTLIEMTMESSGFSANAVDASKFEVPAGFKQVEPEAGR
jgi:hypothetical protein